MRRSPGVDYTGWPQRVIDSSGVQDRAFAWVAWQERVSGELYFAVDHQLATAWDDGGQCAFSGSGDGTLFYPGKTSIIGGTTDIPVESIRLKLIREGMEDYEYLTMVAKTNPALANSVADGLFPTAYECAKTPADLEAARDQLFSVLDVPLPSDASDGGAPEDASSPDGGDAGEGGAHAVEGGDASTTAPPAAQESPAAETSGCALTTGDAAGSRGVVATLLGAIVVAVGRRRRKLGLCWTTMSSTALVVASSCAFVSLALVACLVSIDDALIDHGPRATQAARRMPGTAPTPWSKRTTRRARAA